jgi:SsrA-binding protein
MVKTIVKNKKAFFEYHIIERYIAGIELKGSEIRPIKDSKVNIGESYCLISNGEIFIKNMHVSEHEQGGKANNHDPIRDRKLLLKKKEIINLNDDVKQKGLTIVPLEIILTPTGLIKLSIGLAKGKKLYDKRETTKLKDLERERKREL